MTLQSALTRLKSAQAAAAAASAKYFRLPDDFSSRINYSAMTEACEAMTDAEGVLRRMVLEAHGRDPEEVAPEPVAVLIGSDLAVVSPRFAGDVADFLAIVPSASIVNAD